jgi:hypothetical protein
MIEHGHIKTLSKARGIFSYISGLYQEPYIFGGCGLQDEICIDFTPLGFLHFFPEYAGHKILKEDILLEYFGSGATFFFEQVFDTAENQFNFK